MLLENSWEVLFEKLICRNTSVGNRWVINLQITHKDICEKNSQRSDKIFEKIFTHDVFTHGIFCVKSVENGSFPTGFREKYVCVVGR